MKLRGSFFLSIWSLWTIHNESRQEEFVLFDRNQLIPLKNCFYDAALIYLRLSEDVMLFSQLRQQNDSTQQ